MTKNVLVVDSDQIMLRTLTGLLKSQGEFFNVLTAANTKEAFGLLQKTPLDIVITAIRLPKVDGFRLVTKVTKDYPSIKVILMTKNANPLLRISMKRFPEAVHLDQSHDISMLTKRVFTELQIDYGGRVRGINLTSFLQMMELESCTCTLIVTSKDQSGFIWLQNGELIAAKSTTAKGKEAALDILAWKSVFIDIDYTPHDIERQISMPLMMLMLESSQREDEILSSIENKRAYERYDLLVALNYDIKSMARQCFLRDISFGGAYLETEQDVELGKTISLTLASPRLQSRCSIQARIVRKDGKGAGVSFQFSSPEQEQVIRAMIESTIPSIQQQLEVEPSPA
jgi:CheY-like chemotaxis protein